ncbi:MULTISPECIES: L,D-transpeptidase [unclassified Acinetobacter]|jgi:lipoprotein-anchoring transpeptidase ErfK/SrfK|uniref:L,D-transpeptidase family protein n=1 Tax=Acinetobacter TaxID=469 RepID=UPI0018A8F97F|nr:MULTISPECIES: L,D-transpeptidase [unclassified Acinetobacter]MBJ9952731.1 murein L,D-transpeptidase [Acinetobacter baumannii]
MGKFLPSLICIVCLTGLSIQSQTFAKQNVKSEKNQDVIKTDSKQDWSLNSINNATWSTHLGRGQFPAYARAQVMLNNLHASPGPIDGKSGKNFLKAIAAYQQIKGLPISGELDKATWDSLLKNQTTSAFGTYQITAQDLKGPYAKSIPRNYALQAKMPGLYYTRVSEMLGEKFHIDEDFLKQINPHANFKKVGETINVPIVRNDLPQDVALIIAHKPARQLYLYNHSNQMIASFPATIGGSGTPSPKGTHKVVKVAPNPVYGYNPKNFVQGSNRQKLALPPGPNGPVGNMWIALSKPSFGIHGTPNPSLISKTASHGCIRLTNWDANDLGRKVQPGTVVKFLD